MFCNRVFMLTVQKAWLQAMGLLGFLKCSVQQRPPAGLQGCTHLQLTQLEAGIA